jgi:ATP-binding cassette subfamily B protein
MSDQYFEEEEFTSEYDTKTVLRILSLTKPYWLWVIGFLLAISIVSALDSFFTYLSARIIDEGIVAKDTETLLQIINVYGILIIVQAGFVFGFIFLAGVLGERIRYDLRQTMFNHLQDLSLSYYNQTPVGWIMSRVTSDSDRVAELVTWGILDITWALTNIVTAAFFMFRINWQVALIVLSFLPVIIIIAIQFRKKIIVEFRGARKFNSKITGAYNENITGVRVIKALCREEEVLQEFQSLSSSMYQTSYRAAWLSALFLPIVQMVSALAIGSIVIFGGLSASYGTMTIGGIQAFVSYITFMMWPIQDLARVYAEMQHAIASGERMFSLIDTKPEITDKVGAINTQTIKGEIEFDHVYFTYEDNVPVLTDFNLKINPGETIALVGPTGGGKSTIVNLLCRFFEPVKGVIRINNLDYTNLTLQSVQSRVGIVLQTPHLFSGTIRENIRYGRLHASDAEIEEAARIAGAHEFINSFGQGYDEAVGEGGNLLSTGQKQLISLARAVLAQPEVFIMDEATSSVDTITEAQIQQGMENLMKGRTSIIIAHRLSTIRKADRILVIENGQITEMGNHAELLRARGHYYRLYTQQFRQEYEQEFGTFSAKGYAHA